MRPPATQLLLLGAVGLFGPVNGYQIRRELLSWQADRWANVKPGSIYHALGRLADEGLLRRHDLPEGTREVAVYEITEPGRRRLAEQLADATREVDIFDDRAFHAAFGLLPLLGDAPALDHLDERRRRLAAAIDEFAPAASPNPYVPPHAQRGAQLWITRARAELEWLTGVVDDLRSGELSFQPSSTWAPPADDPGHQMTSDRSRYRALIAERRSTTSE
ncbi:PadR family transcriptional regulator [Gordonia sp. DT30]|uniref:PadR family transcriptional regulator n=1 Tax=unclassified Gordonia (in: high G+C Gram-positive bacteria) TaxID=2657482 RepID=UPI003CF7F8AB